MNFHSQMNSNLLGVEVKNYGECGWCVDEENREVLTIPWEIWTRWLFLSQQMGEKEWGGVFWVEDHTITEFKLPKQEVTSVNCEFKEELGGNGIVHSHHNMDAFHSSEDDAHARNVYDFSIVLSNKGTYEATRKTKLPCGAFGYVKLELEITGSPSEIDLSRISEVKKEKPTGFTKEEPLVHEELGLDDGWISCESCYPHVCKCHYLTEEELETLR